ncbi:MAG TPA: hypothetical protein VEY08_14985, partial [Chloroflexia bacterium]|nr:hypothetical protein [Chloroflexia bacterium]
MPVVSQKRFSGISPALLILAGLLALVFGLAMWLQPISAGAAARISAPNAPSDTTPLTLPVSQTWTITSQITTNDNWSGVPGFMGYLGDDPATTVAPVNPLNIITESATIDVIANQNNTTITNGGVAEFEITDPVVALQGSNTADFPNIVIRVNTTGWQNINVSYLIRDIDGGADDAAQAVNLQYRVGASGTFTNVTGGYIADATTAGTAVQTTPVSAVLPAAADNQPIVDIRIITGNAIGSDEWVGIDDIAIFGTE